MVTISGGKVIYNNQEVCSEQMLDKMNEIYGSDEEVLKLVKRLANNMCCDYSYAASLLLGHKNFVRVIEAIKNKPKRAEDDFDKEWGLAVDISDKRAEKIIKAIDGIK